jgi:hypothetical protein
VIEKARGAAHEVLMAARKGIESTWVDDLEHGSVGCQG